LTGRDARAVYARMQVSYFRARILEQMGDLSRAEHEYEEASKLDPHNVHIKVCLLKLLVRIAQDAKEHDDLNAAQSAAHRAGEMVDAILRYDPNQGDAIYAQEDLYHQYNIQ
ncbi:MAG: hypothetical protein ABIK89_18080, partial [Planctomycetota bacterium]